MPCPPVVPSETVKAAASMAIVPRTVGNNTVRSSMTRYSLESMVSVYSSCSTDWLFQNPAKSGDSYRTSPEGRVIPDFW